MQRLRRHADRGLRVLDTITDGPPSGKHPNLDTRAAIDRLGTHDLKPSDRAPAIIYAASGSMAIAGVWVAWILVSAVMIADGGGGAWVAWFCLGLLGCLRQASNQVTISTYGVSLRDGVAGHRDRHVAYTDIDAVWASRSTLGRWFNYGRIGLHLKNGEVIWGPIIHAPYAAKHAVVQAVTGRRSLLLPVGQQLHIGPLPPPPDPIRQAS